MTSEQRLDRLERIAKLLVRAGLRARGQMREQDEKINILINHQIKADERLVAIADAQARAEESAKAAAAETNDRISVLIASQMKTDEILAALAQSGEQADRRLDRLAETVDRIINEGRDRKSGGGGE